MAGLRDTLSPLEDEAAGEHEQDGDAAGGDGHVGQHRLVLERGGEQPPQFALPRKLKQPVRHAVTHYHQRQVANLPATPAPHTRTHTLI